MIRVRALGAVAIAVAVLSMPGLASAQCNLAPAAGYSFTNPPVCNTPTGCQPQCGAGVGLTQTGGCQTPAATGGAWSLKGTKYDGTCCDSPSAGMCPAGLGGTKVDAPPLRFWQFDNYKASNSGCPTKVTQHNYLCNTKTDFGTFNPAITETWLWTMSQSNFNKVGTDGCITSGTPAVAEVSFYDLNGTAGHTSWYGVASVTANPSYAFNRLTTAAPASVCNGSTNTTHIVPVIETPALTIAGRTAACTGTATATPGTKNAVDGTFFDFSINLANPNPPYYTEIGPNDPARKLIAGWQIVYATGGNTPISGEPTTGDVALGAWKPVRSPTAPTMAKAFWATPVTNPVTVSIPGDATKSFWFATRIVYQDAVLNPAGDFTPTGSGPTLVGPISSHCGPGITTPVSVDFESVAAIRTAKGVTVSWKAVNEDDTTGFYVYRSQVVNGTEATAEKVGAFIESNGGTKPYAVEDAQANAKSAYTYYIQEMTINGEGTRSQSARVEAVVDGASGGRQRGASRH